MILSAKQIHSAEGLEISPYPTSFSATGADLSLGAKIRVWRPTRRVARPSQENYSFTEIIQTYTDEVDISNGFILRPGDFVLGWTQEKFRLPMNLAARVEGKSKLARLGVVVHMTSPTVHAGFGADGIAALQLEIGHHGAMSVELVAGMKICQIIFEQVLV